MGKQQWKFETGFKQQIIGEVESGLVSISTSQPQASDFQQRDQSVAPPSPRWWTGSIAIDARKGAGAGEP